MLDIMYAVILFSGLVIATVAFGVVFYKFTK